MVVTGGASGIGLACARAFSREGASVALWDIQEEAGKAAVREICSQGGTAEFFFMRYDRRGADWGSGFPDMQGFWENGCIGGQCGNRRKENHAGGHGHE